MAKKNNRRDFLKTGALGAVGAGTLGAGLVAGCAAEPGGAPGVQTNPKVVWRLASSFPRSLDTIYGAAETLADRLESMSEGRFTIRSYPAGELVPGLQVLDAAQNGTVQVGHTASYYYTGKNPVLAFDTAMPFGLTSRQQNAWLYQGGGSELMQEAFADFNVIPFPGGNTGTQMGGWFRREVGSLADLQGLKMRIPGLGGEVMSRLGVTVQTIAGGEIYPALERGVIDATEWVGPYDDEKLGFHQIAKNYYYPGWWEPGPNLSLLVNKDAWEKLPANYQSMFKAASYEANMEMQARYDARNPEALQRLLAKGVNLRPFSADILSAARDRAFELMAEEAAKDALYKKVFDHWDAYRKSSYEWFGQSEFSFQNFSFGS